MQKIILTLGLVTTILGVINQVFPSPGYAVSLEEEVEKVARDSLNSYQAFKNIAKNPNANLETRTSVAQDSVNDAKLCKKTMQKALASGMSPSSQIHVDTTVYREKIYITLEQASKGCEEYLNEAEITLASTQKDFARETALRPKPTRTEIPKGTVRVVITGVACEADTFLVTEDIGGGLSNLTANAHGAGTGVRMKPGGKVWLSDGQGSHTPRQLIYTATSQAEQELNLCK
ncbi:hypothetical protein [Calothrix sp. PCC 7507]|uniref:hypothetical protein n=1 Tax=Calothrix sp. PCC 7507 TaxID=99598 RepID=UPI00029F47E3|nr:hypothetical protein [Calothrix sp. PCC 7507]AFY34647.1 hypothetical protein Cal7507_4271 [Calothrix sp. PCC 7507]